MANQGLVSDWVTANKLDTLMTIAEPGDLLEFDRGLYNHWGVYVGFHVMIHFSGTNEVGALQAFSGSECRKAELLLEPIADVMFNNRVRINNGSDKTRSPSAVKTITQRATDTYGNKDWVYNLTTKNCEHFANYCRYGEQKSRQAENAAIGGGVVLGTIVLGLATLGLWAIFRDSNSEETEDWSVRDDDRREKIRTQALTRRR